MAYDDGVSRRFLVDAARRIRCEDDTSNALVRARHYVPQATCRVRSRRAPHFNYALTFDARDLPHLPVTLTRIETALDATRGQCTMTHTGA